MLEKIRRRYLLVKIDGNKIPHERDFQNALWLSLIRLFGEYGASQAEMTLTEYDPKMKYAIIRCSHKSLFMIRPAITTITKIGDAKIALHVLLVSGTLKTLRRRMQKILSILA